MTHNEAVVMYRALMNETATLKGVRFSYAVAKNIEALKPFVTAVEQASKPSEAYDEYEKKRIALAEKHAEKEEDGKPVIQANSYVIEDQDAFDSEFTKLREEHKEVLDERAKQEDDFNKLLEEPLEVSLTTVKLDEVPEDINVSLMRKINSMIEDAQ
jgi:hypothetical protein